MLHKSLRQFIVIVICILPFLQSCGEAETQSNLQVEEGTVSINGTEIYYNKVGEGEPIIVVHGGPVLDHGYLERSFEPLSEHYELLYFDQRLSGRSSADVDSTDITLDNFVEDIEALRQEFNYEKVHLMAHSWGGLLAMKYAIKYPSNLNSLILLNTMPANTEDWRKESQIVARRTSAEDSLRRSEIMSSELFQTNPPEAIEQLLVLSFRNQFKDPSLTDSLDFYIPEDYMIRSQRFGYLMAELSNYNLYAELDSLDIPTLLVYGSNEPAVDISGKNLNSTFPNSQLSVIQNSGHFPFIEQPNQFFEIIQSFLDTLE
ncbi:MAG: alpha/beta hydrolase [Balneolaceae bacterium]|nr:alpha/beta hydrolase [Balneolaceae bacterium]